MRGRRSAEKKQVERKRCKRAKQRKVTEKSDREKRQRKATATGNRDSPAGGVDGAGIGSRKGRGPAQVGRTGAVQLYPLGVPAHNYYLIHTTHSFVPPKTFSRYKTGFLDPLVPLKTFSWHKIPFYFQQGKVTENRNRERDREKRQEKQQGK